MTNKIINKKILLLAILTSTIIIPGQAFALVSNIYELGAALLRPVWVVFSFIAVICFVVAGVLFLTAQGNPEKIAIARRAVIWGAVGVIVGIFAYSSILVIGNLLQ